MSKGGDRCRVSITEVMWKQASSGQLLASGPALSVASELRLGQAEVGDLAQPKGVLEKAEMCTDPSDSTEKQSQSSFARGRCTTWV